MTAPNKLELARSVHARFNNRRPLTDPSERASFLDTLIVALREDDRDDGWRWGRKARAGGQAPTSSGTIAYWLGSVRTGLEPGDGQIDAVDVISSGGDVQWLTGGPDYINIFARWIPVAGDAPPPEEELDGFDTLINVLEKTIDALTTVAAGLERVNETALRLEKNGVPLRWRR